MNTTKSTIHWVPSEGLSHPILETLGPKDHLILAFVFAPEAATDSALEAVEAACTKWGTKEFDEEPNLTGRVLRVRLKGLKAPVKQVRALVDAVGGAIDLKEIFFAPWRKSAGSDLMMPMEDPRAPRTRGGFKDAAEYMKAVLGESEDIPRSEHPMELKGGYLRSDDSMMLEIRGMPLFTPKVRICYGLVRDEVAEATSRLAQVRDSLEAALEKRFSTIYCSPGDEDLRPRFMNRAGQKQAIDRIVWNGKFGYGFAVYAGDLMQAFSTAEIRYRDYELMQALEDVVTKNALAPAIAWRRMGKPLAGPVSQPTHYAIQLWVR